MKKPEMPFLMFFNPFFFVPGFRKPPAEKYFKQQLCSKEIKERSFAERRKRNNWLWYWEYKFVIILLFFQLLHNIDDQNFLRRDKFGEKKSEN